MMIDDESLYDVDLPKEVVARVNIGVVAVSLSLYDEGMTVDELAEVTGIKKPEVERCLEFLMRKRMIRKRFDSNIYLVSNFKKLLRYLIANGLVFPLSEMNQQVKKDSN